MALIFDLDGVLVDAKELHFLSLNKALVDCNLKPISEEQHFLEFDGLPTQEKINRLGCQAHGEKIIQLKNEYVLAEIPNLTNSGIGSIIQKLGQKIYVCSNAQKWFVEECIKMLGFDAEIVTPNPLPPKPAPDMYEFILKQHNECYIFEDNPNGLKAAFAAQRNYPNTKVIRVDDAEDAVHKLKMLGPVSDPYVWHDYPTIIIPMLGESKRFYEKGYTVPKYQLPVGSGTMLSTTIASLQVGTGRLTIAARDNERAYLSSYCVKYFDQNVVTEGMVDTILRTLKGCTIYPDEPLILASCDQAQKYDALSCMYVLRNNPHVDGICLVFKETEGNPKWSFCKTRENSNIIEEVAEKRPISQWANCGVYFWKRAADFIRYAEQMMAANDRVRNEFYAAPVFNYAIKDGKNIIIKEAEEFYPLGVPEDYEKNKDKVPF